MWVALYLVHVVVGAGGMAVLSGLFWPEIINRSIVVRVLPLVLGALAGVILAERSRRSGSLLSRSKIKKGARRID
jgi:hypothetical protein